jgi:LAS superfamily LD-carboxypeptidase LdcB
VAGEADGALPDQATVFDTQYPGIANLDPAFLQALRDAATAAAAEKNRVVFYVSSGWRSPAYQEQLLREAVTVYGSAAEASKWVAPPDKSLHVSGGAVDLVGSEALSWLAGHGARYGLCQVYQNEPWHYEHRPEAKDRGCPAMYADAAHDPRLR